MFQYMFDYVLQYMYVVKPGKFGGATPKMSPVHAYAGLTSNTFAVDQL